MKDMKRLFHSLSRTNDGAFVIDGHHRITFWNQAAEGLLGYTADEVSGRSCYEILGGRDEQGLTLCQRFCQVVIQAERGDVLPNRNVYVRTKSGEGRWLNVTTVVYPGLNGSSGQAIVHLFRDATEQKNNQRFVGQVLAASERLHVNGTAQLAEAKPAEPHVGGLTAREQQVLELLAQGLGTNEIADKLTISPLTVRNHVQNILSKLGVHSRLEATAYAYQNGLIENNGS